MQSMIPVAALLVATASFAQEGDDEKPAVARLFEENCAACHQPPDPAFAVDRAWITQLTDTA